MTYTPITPTMTDKNSPINVTLMDRIRTNFDDHETRIINLEGAGGGGSGGSSALEAVGKIISGSDDAQLDWIKRISPFENTLNNVKNRTSFDPENIDDDSLITFLNENGGSITRVVDARSYLGEMARFQKNDVAQFKLSDRVNRFAVSFGDDSNTTDSVTITINGASLTSLGIVDENGTAYADTFSTVGSTFFAQHTRWFYNLPTGQNVIRIENTDSASKFMQIDSYYYGFRSENPTIDHTIKLSDGKAEVRGSKVNFSETEFTFGETRSGHTASIICDDTGTLSKYETMGGAMSRGKPELSYGFSGAVTTLPMDNVSALEEKGIGMMTTPYGDVHAYSWNAKTETTVQTNSLDGVIWETQPTEDFTPLSNFESATTGDSTGDLIFNAWARGTIEITSSFNKIDFKVTSNGVETTHVATLAAGIYSSNIVKIGNEISRAMAAAKPINGTYKAEYNNDSQLWTISVQDSQEISELQLLFSSGANLANSVHTLLGFLEADVTGKTSHQATIEVQSRAILVYSEGDWLGSEDPRIKYNQANSVPGGVSTAPRKYVENELGFGSIRSMNSTLNYMQIAVDPDTTGISVTFMSHFSGGMISAQIDSGENLYLLQTQAPHINTSERAGVISAFISYPRGSKIITLYQETNSNFNLVSTSDWTFFVGCRQYHSATGFESLALDSSIIKCLDIAPEPMFENICAFNAGAQYSPNNGGMGASQDNLNIVTESGSWSGVSDSVQFNRGSRRTATAGDYVEYDFTIQKDGGGISLMVIKIAAGSKKVALYISTSAINEGTDLVSMTHLAWSVGNQYDSAPIGIYGLPAGTYKARFKNVTAGNFYPCGIKFRDGISGINVYTHGEVDNTGQGLFYPANTKKIGLHVDSKSRVPVWLQRERYQDNKMGAVDYKLNYTSFIANTDDADGVRNFATSYFVNWGRFANVNEFYRSQAFCRSYSFSTMSQDGVSNLTNTASVDGVSAPSTFTTNNNVKGGSNPSSTRGSQYQPFQKQFQLACSQNAGLVYDIVDTKGIRDDRTVILYDGTNFERVVVDSFVTDTTFTIKAAPTTVVPANVESVDFSGHHTMKIDFSGSNFTNITSFNYEPLPIEPSGALERLSPLFEPEIVVREYSLVGNGQDLFYPIFSDGTSGDSSNSTRSVHGKTSGSATYSFPTDLKNIQVSAGTINVTIVSTKQIKVIK